MFEVTDRVKWFRYVRNEKIGNVPTKLKAMFLCDFFVVVGFENF